MPVCLIGVDVGSTNAKAGAFTPEGKLIAVAGAELVVERPRPGWAVYDPEKLWESVAAAIREVVTRLEGAYHPLAVAVSSMAETAIALDRKGVAVYPAIAWFDLRTVEQADWLKREVGSEYVFARTGLPIQPIFGLNKLLWLKQNEPALFGRIACWLNVADYINFRLCGVQATELSLASRVMALDLKQGRWSDDLLSRLGISTSILGELVPGAQPLGSVAAESAAITGLLPETKVVSGGHDHPCAAVGAGVFDPGVVLDSLGTSESLVIILDKPILNPSAAAFGFAVGYHVLPGRFQSIGGLATSGAAIDWFRNAFFGALSRGQAYAEMEHLAEKAAAGSGGVFFLPYLRVGSPPNNETNTRGAFIGLSADTTQNDLCRSLYEGLAYSVVDCLNALRASFQTDVKQIRVVGGPTRNRLWMRIKASMTSEPLRVVEVEEAACRGAAVLAGLGAGCYSSIEDARQTIAFDEIAIIPDPQWQKAYDWGYRSVYSRIQGSLRVLHQEICRGPLDL